MLGRPTRGRRRRQGTRTATSSAIRAVSANGSVVIVAVLALAATAACGSANEASGTTVTTDAPRPSAPSTTEAAPTPDPPPPPAPVDPAAPVARLTLHVGSDAQTVQGFGAYLTSLVYGDNDYLTDSQRRRALRAAYRDVGLTTGNLDASGLLESPGDFTQQANDDHDPNHIENAGFQTFSADALHDDLLVPAEPLGLTDYYLAPKINLAYGNNPWLRTLRSTDYDRFLDEAAEQVVAALRYWRDAYDVTTPYAMLLNEPTSGNHELAGAGTGEVVDIVTRVGDRLADEGFEDVRFVIGNEETEERSLAVATALLDDPGARPYVGAIGYHTYPYGSSYSSIARILDTSGRGAPDQGRVAVRERLRALGERHGVPVWQTEVSDPTWGDPRSYDAFRARAIHIHDELRYANASVYQAMLSMWDTRSQADHHGNTALYRGEGHVVLIDQDTDAVTITGMGRAIGHYARWLTPGDAVRVDDSSSDPLVLVSGFRDGSGERLTAVVINNAAEPRTARLVLDGGRLVGPVTGEQSSPAGYWQAVGPYRHGAGGTFSLTVPAHSVTTLTGDYER